jgi:HK97 family phage major capsid protein
MALNTDASRPSWNPDLYASLDADDLVPDALIIRTGTYAGSVEGDAPSVRVPYVSDDGTAAVVAEGGTITPNDSTPAEIVFATDKVSRMIKVSREQLAQSGAAERLARSMARSVIVKADDLYLNNAANPTGLLLTAGLATAGDLGGATDPTVFEAYDAVGAIENDGGQATHILFNPLDWALLSKLPDETGSARSLLADVHDASRRSLAGVPVIVSNHVTQGAALMLDQSEIITAYGNLLMARSDDFYFDSDSVALRLTWRLGFKVARVARLQRLTVAAA